MTPRESFITALEGGQPLGHVPTFELGFYLTMELLGKVHPMHRHLARWDQMSRTEQDLQIADVGDVYIAIAEHNQHAAIRVRPVSGMPESEVRISDYIRSKTDDRFFLAWTGEAKGRLKGMIIPSGDKMMEWCFRLIDDPGGSSDGSSFLIHAVAGIFPAACLFLIPHPHNSRPNGLHRVIHLAGLKRRVCLAWHCDRSSSVYPPEVKLLTVTGRKD